MTDDWDDIEEFMEQRLIGVRDVDQVDLDQLDEGEVAPAVIINYRGCALILLPTVVDGTMDVEIAAFFGGRRLESSLAALRIGTPD